MKRIALLLILFALAVLTVACGSSEASVTGAITFEGDAEIPDDAKVIVKIEDSSLADAPAETIGEQIITNDTQFPIPYEVTYDADEIVDNHTYTMRARIEGADGSLLFINDTSIPVITRGNPTDEVEIPVIQVGS
jgi:putative lipoprotein